MPYSFGVGVKGVNIYQQVKQKVQTNNERRCVYLEGGSKGLVGERVAVVWDIWGGF